jgi:hypothetical protein
MPDSRLVELMTLMKNECLKPQEENRTTINTLLASLEAVSADKRELQLENEDLKQNRVREVEIERQRLEEDKESVEEKNRKLDELLKQFEDQQEDQETQEKSAGVAKLQAAEKIKSLSDKITELGAELNQTCGLYTLEIKSHNSTKEKFRKDVMAQKKAHAIQLKRRQEEVDKIKNSQIKNSQTGSTASWWFSQQQLDLRKRVEDWVTQCKIVDDHADKLEDLKKRNEGTPNEYISKGIEEKAIDLEAAIKSRQDSENSLREYHGSLAAVESISRTSLEDGGSNKADPIPRFSSALTDVTSDPGYISASSISGERIKCPHCRRAWNPKDSF